MTNLLKISDLRTYFHLEGKVVRAVDGVSLSVKEGETLGLVGESGCGKSVTALSVLGLIADPGRIEGGEILFEGRNLLDLSPAAMRRLRGNAISMIFQEPMTSLNPVFRIGFQIAEALRLHEGMSAKAAREMAIELLDLVGIPAPKSRVDDYPHQLSGGMKQRVMIAMALACRPKLLIADEPTTALDVTIQAQILELLRDLQKKYNMAVILITHDLAVVAEVADRVVVMYAGKVVEECPTADLFTKPCHPYTVGLFNSLPQLSTLADRLNVIEGELPTPDAFPHGCRFHPRCRIAVDACRQEEPSLIAVDARHSSACIRVENQRLPESLFVPKEPPTTPPERGIASAAAVPPGNGGQLSPPLLDVRNLQTYFPIRTGIFSKVVNHVRAVDGISIAIGTGKTLGLVGESGCGKTTVGRSILNLVKPTQGQVLYDGQDLLAMRPDQLRLARRDLQIIFQDPYGSLNPRMTVGSIIGEGLKVHGIGNFRERQDRVREAVERVGLDPSTHLQRYPHEFSGGQRQRIGIARALVLSPRFIVCDEAVSALDVSIQAQIINLLMDLQMERHYTYLFIAHDLSVIRHISDQVAVMYLGRIAEIGPVEDIFDNPRHPYTQALLDAVPIPEPPSDRAPRQLLGGDVPSPIDPPTGCRFHTRCPKVMELCRAREPEAVEVEEGHVSWCFLEGEG